MALTLLSFMEEGSGKGKILIWFLLPQTVQLRFVVVAPQIL